MFRDADTPGGRARRHSDCEAGRPMGRRDHGVDPDPETADAIVLRPHLRSGTPGLQPLMAGGRPPSALFPAGRLPIASA